MGANGSHKFVDRKVIIRLKDRVCENSEELFASSLFREVIYREVARLKKRESPLLGVFAPMLPPAAVSEEEAVRLVGLVVKEIASHGNVLILGQGAQVWLGGYAGTCHVQVVAPLELRIKRVAERDGLSGAVARRRVLSSDRARSDYLARYYNAHWLDPLLYHLVINTGCTPVEAAVSLIAHAAQAIGGGM
jgi:cytidylate kinase